MTKITDVRSKIDTILAEGVMDGAASKLNRLITELHPWIEHLPSFNSIERHLLSLVANQAVHPGAMPGRSDGDFRREMKRRDAAGEKAANERSQKALHIIRGYIRCREALKKAGKEDLPAHMEALAALHRSKRFDDQYLDAIFQP